jgi:hypothetical protein
MAALDAVAQSNAARGHIYARGVAKRMEAQPWFSNQENGREQCCRKSTQSWERESGLAQHSQDSPLHDVNPRTADHTPESVYTSPFLSRPPPACVSKRRLDLEPSQSMLQNIGRAQGPDERESPSSRPRPPLPLLLLLRSPPLHQMTKKKKKKKMATTMKKSPRTLCHSTTLRDTLTSLICIPQLGRLQQ